MSQMSPPPGGLTARSVGSWAGVPLPDGLLDRLPVGLYRCAPDGAVVAYNEAAAALWGRAPDLDGGRERFCGSHRLLDLDGRHVPHEFCPMARALASGEPVRDGRIQIERLDGSRLRALVNIEVLKDESGAVTGAVNLFREDDRTRAPEVQPGTGPDASAEAVLRVLPGAVYTTDAEGRITFYNEAAVELWGLRPELGSTRFCGSWKLYWPDGTPLAHEDCPMALALKERRAFSGVECQAERPDGTRVPFRAFPRPLFDASGALIGVVNMLMDITASKRLREQQELLFDEMAHRVKNFFALSSTVVGLSAEGASSTQDLVRAARGRLAALARAHALVLRRPTAEAGAGQAIGLRELAQTVFSAYERPRDAGTEAAPPPRIALEGPAVELAGDAVTSFALILHELATNAAKYGALSVGGGRVALTWHLLPEHLVLEWKERGGPPLEEGEPARDGFGSALARLTVQGQLGGSLERHWERQGLAVVLTASRSRLGA